MPPVRNLILVLGDQLTPTLTSLASGDPARDLVLMAEVHDEATYVPHHKKKIAFLFAAMQHFAGEMRAAGWRVEYVRLDAPGNRGSFTEEVARAVAAHRPERIVVTEAGEWRGCEEGRNISRSSRPEEHAGRASRRTGASRDPRGTDFFCNGEAASWRGYPRQARA